MIVLELDSTHFQLLSKVTIHYFSKSDLNFNSSQSILKTVDKFNFMVLMSTQYVSTLSSTANPSQAPSANLISYYVAPLIDSLTNAFPYGRFDLQTYSNQRLFKLPASLKDSIVTEKQKILVQQSLAVVQQGKKIYGFESQNQND